MITSETRVITYTGTGAVSTYAYPFLVYDEDHLVVKRIDTNNVTTTQVITTDYTVTGVKNSGGGNVELVAALETDYTLVIQRTLPLTQLLNFTTQGAFNPETIEQGLDMMVMLAQQMSDVVAMASAAVYTSASEPAASASWAGLFIRVRDTGQAEVWKACVQNATDGVWEWVEFATGSPW